MPVKDTQGALSQTGAGAFDGLPSSGMTVEVIKDTQTGGSGSQGGTISTDRASEDH